MSRADLEKTVVVVVVQEVVWIKLNSILVENI